MYGELLSRHRKDEKELQRRELHILLHTNLKLYHVLQNTKIGYYTIL